MQLSPGAPLLQRTSRTDPAGLVPGTPDEDDARLLEDDGFEGDLDEEHDYDFDDDDEDDDFIDDDEDEEGDEEDDFV